MAYVAWRMKGRHLKNCNCDFGCPCDFLGPPSHHVCHGFIAMKIDEGNFGDVKLDGLHWAGIVDFPGPLHEGNGVMQPVLDARASEAQRNALGTILSGREQAPTTMFSIFNSLLTTVHEPVFANFVFEHDYAARRAKLAIPGVVDCEITPIVNPVTGQPHRIRVEMPEGFEYQEAEIASGRAKVRGNISFELENCHGSLSLVTYNQDGFVR
jgi:hypothetical protein